MKNSGLAITGWERAMNAADKVKDRLRRCVRVLEEVGFPYAVVGGPDRR
jgi:hypothetical protein